MFLLRKSEKYCSESGLIASAFSSIFSRSFEPALATTASYIFSSSGNAEPCKVPYPAWMTMVRLRSAHLAQNGSQ